MLHQGKSLYIAIAIPLYKGIFCFLLLFILRAGGVFVCFHFRQFLLAGWLQNTSNASEIMHFTWHTLLLKPWELKQTLCDAWSTNKLMSGSKSECDASANKQM